MGVGTDDGGLLPEADPRGDAAHATDVPDPAATIGTDSRRRRRNPREHAVWTRTPLGPGGPALDLLTARFDRHRYAPHCHEEFSVGIGVSGHEVIDYRGGTLHLGPGSIVVLAPGEVHTGGPGASEGYAYRAMYPAAHLLAEGTATPPYFRDPVVNDPELAAALRAAHAELSVGADALEVESRLPWLFAALARRHGTAVPSRAPVSGADRIARVVRESLADGLLAPPSLADLAAPLGLSRYQLLRAFRTSTGLPPYAWLAQYRVTRARAHLEAGRTPAQAAALVGFADQAHLTRWFRRVLGVTPAAYRNSVQDARR
ncbi:AraC family transcriptional regulator [Streptomyces formicae]